MPDPTWIWHTYTKRKSRSQIIPSWNHDDLHNERIHHQSKECYLDPLIYNELHYNTNIITLDNIIKTQMDPMYGIDSFNQLSYKFGRKHYNTLADPERLQRLENTRIYFNTDFPSKSNKQYFLISIISFIIMILIMKS